MKEKQILFCISGPLQGHKFAVNKEYFRIGTSRENDLVIAGDNYVSSNHAYLRYDGGTLSIVDQHSTNGTFVNNIRLKDKPIILNSGDRIRIGNSIFEVGKLYNAFLGSGKTVNKQAHGIDSGVSTIPAHIRENLKAFDNYQNLMCLECGYSGMMGVKANIVPWYVSWWTIAFVGIVFAIFSGTGFGIGILFGVCLGIMRFALIKHVVVCPNCGTEGCV
jgi:FHA domain